MNDHDLHPLDYPPISAYHSYVVGIVGKMINPKYVEAHTSYGIQTTEHKIFMRASVIISDLLIYFVGIIFFIFTNKMNETLKYCFLIISLNTPGVMLIDHSHFQYNVVMFG